MSNERFHTPDQAFARIEHASRIAAPTPSTKQAEAGNYAKGRISLYGLPITLENARASVRSGVGQNGKAWSNRMAAHYGEFAGTRGADGDPVDVFVGLFPESHHVWVVNQCFADGAFDEHKVMLCFATAQQARDAYMGSFDRGWTGLLSMVPVSLSQLRWWLKHGDMRRALSLDQLPSDGTQAMNTTQWDKDANPLTPLHRVMYDMRANDREGLLLDAVTVDELLADPELEQVPQAILDALVVQVNKMSIKMDLMQRVMESAGGDLKPSGYVIGDPVRARGVMQVPVVFALSDGQAITIWFHNPDTTPNKITPLDELISWKWMLNKKDITIVVAPERGKDLNVREVARRIMRLAVKNAEAFAKANTNAAARAQEDKALDAEIASLETELGSLQNQIEVAKQQKEDDAANQAMGIMNALSLFSWKLERIGGQWRASKIIGGGRTGGVMNPEGDRRVVAMVVDSTVRVDHGPNLLHTEAFTAGESSEAIAERVNDAVNAMDPRHAKDDRGGASGEYRYDVDRADGVAITFTAPDSIAGFKIWSREEADALAKVDAAIELHKASPHLDTRWVAPWGAVTAVRLSTFGTLGEGSELYQVSYDDGSARNIQGREFAETAAKQAFDATPEGRQAAEQRQAQYEADLKAQEERARAAEAAEVAWLESLEGFADGMAPMQKARALETLKKLVRRQGKEQRLSALLRSLVDDGWTVQADRTYGRILAAPDGAFIEQKRLTKIGLDFAAFLIAKRAGSQEQESEPTPAARVDAAYTFDSATEAFKAMVADTVDKDDYSAFKSAKVIDMAAKAAGASVAWDVRGTAVMDSTELAEAELLRTLQTVETNLPISQAEGDVGQAELQADVAASVREALEILSGQDEPVIVLDDEGADDFDPDAEWEATPEEDGEEVEAAA